MRQGKLFILFIPQFYSLHSLHTQQDGESPLVKDRTFCGRGEYLGAPGPVTPLTGFPRMPHGMNKQNQYGGRCYVYELIIKKEESNLEQLICWHTREKWRATISRKALFVQCA